MELYRRAAALRAAGARRYARTMFCTGCGSVLSEQAKYCPNCGKPTAPAAGVRHTAPRLTRPIYEKKIAGVCAGFARYIGADVTLIRVVWVIATVLTGIPL